MLLISEPLDALEPFADLLTSEGHHVDRAQNGIEANDLILTGLAVSSPYELIVLHHSQNKSDTRELIKYWRNQDPFLPLVLISMPQTLTDQDLRALGLLDCIPEDTPIQLAKNRLDLLQQTVALGSTYRVKADILTKPASMNDPLASVNEALDHIQDRVTVRAVAFVSYTAVINDPIMQLGKHLEIYDQIWLDDLCEQAFERLEPILKSNRMVFEPSESPRYLFPISTTRGWEGLLVFFAPMKRWRWRLRISRSAKQRRSRCAGPCVVCTGLSISSVMTSASCHVSYTTSVPTPLDLPTTSPQKSARSTVA